MTVWSGYGTVEGLYANVRAIREQVGQVAARSQSTAAVSWRPHVKQSKRASELDPTSLLLSMRRKRRRRRERVQLLLSLLLAERKRLANVGTAELDLEHALHLPEQLRVGRRLHVLILLDHAGLLVHSLGELALRHGLGVALRVLELLTCPLDHLAELHRDL